MISGKKVVIKGITKESEKEIYSWVNTEELRKYTGTIYPISEYEHEEWIKKVTSSSNMKLFLITEKDNNLNIGTIGLKNFDYTNKNVEIFISIGNPAYLNGGYGSDALDTFINYIFNNLNFHKVYLKVFESNVRAINCYEKIGMTVEGKLIDHHFQNGKYENVIIMSKIIK